ncbi:MAG TPA: VOC family protein [Candidatus Sulfotelmatobacter sp.]|jgi:catechol 2,3-dioxygenase-like lactoylglutathione lyase family enzyme|nr:VOC family protein [Candidatus Sulfotelmatobacter sp.]
MLSYVYYGTNDLPAAIVFYDAVLEPLGMRRVATNDAACDRVSAGWGLYDEGRGLELAFWIGLPFDGRPAGPGNGSMVAFRAVEPAQVDAFHAAALAHGGVSEGEPGFRRHYGPDFYAAYVRDRDGNKLAAVCWSGW